MKELIGLSREELATEMTRIGEKPFRVKQLWHWLYHQGVTDFSLMTSISKGLQQKLAERYTITRPQIITEQTSKDTTRKWLMRFGDGKEVEAVYIPEEDRGAVCLSTQVGCAQKCAFCHTGTQGLQRNLTAGEIIGQFMVARDSYQEWPTPTDETRFLSNIVVMGMGEPLHNYDNTVKAMKIAMDGEGIAISKRRITISTSGVADKIPNLATDLGVKLAISLHAPNNSLRDKLMPVNKRWPLEKLIKACQEYQTRLEHRQYITFEYIMLDDVNDSPSHAHELIELSKNLEVKVNLIPFNPWDGCSFKPSTPKNVARFQKIIETAHIPCPVRVARGQDIMAACGQLKSVFNASQN